MKGSLYGGKKRRRRRIGIGLLVVAAAVCLLLGGLGRYRHMQELYAGYHGISLSNREELVEAVRSGMQHHARTITLTFTAHVDSMEDISTLADTLVEAAYQETDDPTAGDYLRWQQGGYEVRYQYEKGKGLRRQDYHYTVKIVPDYYTYLSEEETLDEEIARVIASFGFDADTTDYEKVRTIYDYICDHVYYYWPHRRASNNHSVTTAYSALIRHTATCQGYCVLAYRLLREAGVSARIISGRGYQDGWEEYHSWNIVAIDGLYYNLDITWDQTLETTEYFLKCDAHFGEHERDPEYATAAFYQAYPMAQADWPNEGETE